jgi:hypothetical protein
MRTDKYVELTCELIFFQRILNVMPSDFPLHRELVIQNAKLQRMLLNPPATSQQIMSSGSLKKWKKLYGQYFAKCGRQAKRVRSMTEKAFKEGLRREWPLHGKVFTNREFRDWKLKFDHAMSAQVKRLAKELSDDAMHKIVGQTSSS